MTQAGLTDEHAGGPSVFDLPKLEPKQVNERARIWIPDPDRIAMYYAHAIGGKRMQQPGQPEPGWGGNWMCLGNPEVLKGNAPHSDPANCGMCQMVAEGHPYVEKAKRKWLVQVFRYATDPSGAQPLQPFTMGLVVWVFSDKQYRQLLEIQNQWGPIRDRDLLLTSDQQEFPFKQWSVSPLPELLVTRDPSYTAFMEQAWQTQAVDPDELGRIIGRTPANMAEVQAKITEITPAVAAMYDPAAMGYPQPGMMPPGLPAAPGVPPMPQQPMAAPPVPGMPPAAAPAMPAPVAAPVPGQVPTPGLPPAMPPTPAPAEAPGTALPVPPPQPGAGVPPAAPGYPQQQVPAGYPQQQAPAGYPPQAPAAPVAPQVPQMPPAAPAAPPAAPQAPMPPQQPMAPQAAPMPPAQPMAPQQPQAPAMPPAGVVAQPGAPAAAPTADFTQLVAPPAPPAPPA